MQRGKTQDHINKNINFVEKMIKSINQGKQICSCFNLEHRNKI